MRDMNFLQKVLAMPPGKGRKKGASEGKKSGLGAEGWLKRVFRSEGKSPSQPTLTEEERGSSREKTEPRVGGC